MIYLDNAGTTKVSESVINAMLPYFNNVYGNASSLHEMGQIAKEALENARKAIAEVLNASSDEIYFTSGGSESDNLAIKSLVEWGKKKDKTHIVTSKIEHHAVLETLKALEKQGFDVTYLDVDEDGIVDPESVKEAITEKTAFVTIMMANNEIGTIEPIAEIAKVCEDKGVYFFTDAVQAVGHIKVDVKQLGVSMLALSAHKFHGPKGVGALYVKKGIPLFSQITGGGQERNKRAGTENVAGIVGMATALKEASDEMEQVAKKERQLRDKLIAELGKISHSKLNGHQSKRLPNNFNMSFEGIEGESLILLLSDEGICSTSGSACTSGSLDPSHVLLAIGLPHEVAHGSLRLTLSKYTTEAEIDKVIETVPKVVELLRNMSPVWDELVHGKREFMVK